MDDQEKLTEEKLKQMEEIERMRKRLEEKQRELDVELQKKREQLARIQQMKQKLETERDRSEQDFREKINQVRSLTEALMESTKLVCTMANGDADNGNDGGINVEQSKQLIEELKLHCLQAKEKIEDVNETIQQRQEEEAKELELSAELENFKKDDI